MYFIYDQEKQRFMGYGNNSEVYYTSKKINTEAISGGINVYSGQDQTDRVLRILHATNPVGCEVQLTGSTLNDLIRAILTNHGQEITAFSEEDYRETGV